jgi:iron complex transport system ATP-binding protein
MTESLLQLENLEVGYDGKPLYGDVNLRVETGEMVALLGSNGAGKSTLLRCVTGHLRPLRGVVRVNGTDLASVSKRELAKLVSVVNTDQTLAGALTVWELAALGRQPHTGFFGRLSQHDNEVVATSLQSVGMERFARRQVASLSDGERQKVMIARALAQETPLMVLDEPTAFLDVASRLETLQLLAELARNAGKGIVLSCHDVGAALRLAGRLWLIIEQSGAESGSRIHSRRIVDGTPTDLIADGTLNRLFPNRNVAFSPEILDFLPKIN